MLDGALAAQDLCGASSTSRSCSIERALKYTAFWSFPSSSNVSHRVIAPERAGEEINGLILRAGA